MGMRQIAGMVRAAPGLVGWDYAREYVTQGNHFSTGLGYAALYRAEKHGLIHRHPGVRSGSYVWYPGEKHGKCHHP